MIDPKKIQVRHGGVPAVQEIDVLNDDVSELDEFAVEAERLARSEAERIHRMDVVPGRVTILDIPRDDTDFAPDGDG